MLFFRTASCHELTATCHEINFEVGSVTARPATGRGNRRAEDESDDDRFSRGGGSGQPPEWDGVS